MPLRIPTLRVVSFVCPVKKKTLFDTTLDTTFAENRGGGDCDDVDDDADDGADDDADVTTVVVVVAVVVMLLMAMVMMTVVAVVVMGMGVTGLQHDSGSYHLALLRLPSQQPPFVPRPRGA